MILINSENKYCNLLQINNLGKNELTLGTETLLEM